MRLTDEGVYEETKRIVREQTIIRAKEQVLRAESRRLTPYEQQLDRLAEAWAIERALYDPRPRSERRAAHPATQPA